MYIIYSMEYIMYDGNIDFNQELHSYVKEVLKFNECKNTKMFYTISDEDVKNVNNYECLSTQTNINGTPKNIYYFNNEVIKVDLYSYDFHHECERTKQASDLGLGAPFIKYVIHTNKTGDKCIFLYTKYVNECNIEELYTIVKTNNNINTQSSFYNLDIVKKNHTEPILFKLSDKLYELINSIYLSNLKIHFDLNCRNIRKLNGKLIAIDWSPDYRVFNMLSYAIYYNEFENNELKKQMIFKMIKIIYFMIN